ncbi:MAG: hypothetical protein B1H11_00685 [Desulfobacteraceae bacterium 4484_190.1]|nr:MAG: hypothetical protein B1H11_00685 [Desulfobacteraceae bacterium 4484_190.1]HDH87722.1 long-chain fatty acid--CoA ligase [Desulfobacteraceae bacterium]
MLEDTLPKLLLARFREFGEGKVAMRRKDYGLWIQYTWKDSYENVKFFSLGLISLGLKPGEKIAIIGDNDPEWYWSAFAIQSSGGVVAGIFSDSIVPEVEYLLGFSDTVYVVAEDQEQVDKILEIRDKNPNLRKVIYWDPKGMYTYKDDPFVIDFYEVVRLGREYEKAHQGLFEENVENGKPEDIGVILFTSGTTGAKPKGIEGSQAYLVAAGKAWCEVDQWSAEDNYVSYLSPAWATEWIMGISSGLREGTTVCFPEKPETVQNDIREIGPEVLFYSARLWESLNATIQMKISDTLALFRFIFNVALKIGYKVVDARFQKKKIRLSMRVLYKFADRLVFRQLRDLIGLSNIKWAYTAGSSISPDILRFFHAIGVNLKQTYGLTEAMTNTVHRDGEIRPETCGPALPGNRLKISDSGELLIKPPVPFSGYYKNPDETKRKFDKDGWIKTGDSASIAPDGHLIIYGRMEELVPMGKGKMFSPEFIETRLRFSPYIQDVMTIGGHGENSFVAALVVIQYSNVGKWAEGHHMTYTTFADLSQKPMVYELILKDLEHVNLLLPEWSKIKKFVLLPKEFDPDEAELTRTRKLRRSFMATKYKFIIDALYGDSEEAVIETPFTYRDGRKGILNTTVKIKSIEE